MAGAGTGPGVMPTAGIKPLPNVKGGGQMYAGGTPNFDERTGTMRPTPMGSANPLSGMTPDKSKRLCLQAALSGINPGGTPASGGKRQVYKRRLLRLQ